MKKHPRPVGLDRLRAGRWSWPRSSGSRPGPCKPVLGLDLEGGRLGDPVGARGHARGRHGTGPREHPQPRRRVRRRRARHLRVRAPRSRSRSPGSARHDRATRRGRSLPRRTRRRELRLRRREQAADDGARGAHRRAPGRRGVSRRADGRTAGVLPDAGDREAREDGDHGRSPRRRSATPSASADARLAPTAGPAAATASRTASSARPASSSTASRRARRPRRASSDSKVEVTRGRRSASTDGAGSRRPTPTHAHADARSAHATPSASALASPSPSPTPVRRPRSPSSRSARSDLPCDFATEAAATAAVGDAHVRHRRHALLRGQLGGRGPRVLHRPRVGRGATARDRPAAAARRDRQTARLEERPVLEIVPPRIRPTPPPGHVPDRRGARAPGVLVRGARQARRSCTRTRRATASASAPAVITGGDIADGHRASSGDATRRRRMAVTSSSPDGASGRSPTPRRLR